jgi:D-sedoheptulose 7-phosphate isomerase
MTPRDIGPIFRFDATEHAAGTGGMEMPERFSAPAYLADLTRAIATVDTTCLERMADAIEACCRAGGTVFCVGNGGSASTASHLATDLTKLTLVLGNTSHLRVLSLVDSVATLTAAANDVSYDESFVEPLRAWLQPGDVVVAISTSGRSRNVLRALEFARGRGAVLLAFTGQTGGPMQGLADETFVIASENVQRVEDVTMVAGHLLCLMVRDRRAHSAMATAPGHLQNRATV